MFKRRPSKDAYSAVSAFTAAPAAVSSEEVVEPSESKPEPEPSPDKPPPTPEDTMGLFREVTTSGAEKESVTDKLLGKDSKARGLATDSSARKREAEKIEKLLMGAWP